MNLGDNGGVNVEELLAELPTGWLYAALVAWSLGRSTFYYVSGRLATSRIFGVAVIAALASGAAPWLLAVLAIVVIAYVLRRRQRGRDAVAVDREESSKDHMLADPVQNVDPT